jgi:membrane fusion protein (multidrug efflux system)
VTISAEASGRVDRKPCRRQRRVKKGDVLFVIDPEPYRIALEQAEAALAAPG